MHKTITLLGKKSSYLIYCRSQLSECLAVTFPKDPYEIYYFFFFFSGKKFRHFRKSVFAAAANTGRSVRILHQLCQPADHPVNIYHPESEYLKGLVLYID